jgi:hypothetical protein
VLSRHTGRPHCRTQNETSPVMREGSARNDGRNIRNWPQRVVSNATQSSRCLVDRSPIVLLGCDVQAAIDGMDQSASALRTRPSAYRKSYRIHGTGPLVSREGLGDSVDADVASVRLVAANIAEPERPPRSRRHVFPVDRIGSRQMVYRPGHAILTNGVEAGSVPVVVVGI